MNTNVLKANKKMMLLNAKLRKHEILSACGQYVISYQHNKTYRVFYKDHESIYDFESLTKLLIRLDDE